MKKRMEYRQVVLIQNRKRVTAKKLLVILQQLQVPCKKKNKAALTKNLLKFYQNELAMRTSSNFSCGSLKMWNMNPLVQVLKIRYRRYFCAIIPLYSEIEINF